MKIKNLVGLEGAQFEVNRPGEIPGVATYIAQTNHPVFPGFTLVIWRMPDGSVLFDALTSEMELPEPVEGSMDDPVRSLNLKRAMNLGI